MKGRNAPVALGQLRWSKKRTISGYDTQQKLVFIIKDPKHVNFMNNVIIAALKKINEALQEEQVNAAVQKVPVESPGARSIRRLPREADEGRSAGQGSRNGEPEEAPGTRPEDEEEPLTPI